MAHLNFHHIVGRDEIKEILVYQQHKIIKTPQAQNYTGLALGEGLLSTDGEKWVSKRKPVNHLFGHQSIEKWFPLIKAEALATIKTVKGNEIDISQFHLEVTLRIISQIAFGQAGTTYIPRIEQAMALLIAQTYKKVIAPINPPIAWPTTSNKKFNTSRKEFDGIIKELTSQAAKQDQQGGMATQLFLQYEEKEALEETAIALKSIIAAGHETTATTLNWLMYEVFQKGEVRSKLEKELISFSIDDTKNTQELLAQTPFTQQVIYETMRLYPSIWLMGRMATDTITLKDTTLKKKDNILISPYVMHRHDKYWENPQDFQPERFQDGMPDFSSSGYFPFGLGGRSCIGAQLAMIEMITILATLYQRFQVNPHDLKVISPVPYITLRQSVPLYAHLTPRQE